MKKGEETASPSTAAAPKTNEPAGREPAKEHPKDVLKDVEDLRRRLRGLEEERERLRNQNQGLHDKHLRARADYDNLVKRSQKEIQDTVRFVKSGMLLRVASLFETFETLAQDIEKRLGAEAKGLKMVLDDAKKLLRDEGIKEIPSRGLPFNFRFHQAVERVETSAHAEGVIVEVVQRGYQMGDEVLRPALVKVAVPPKASQEAAPSGSRA